MSMIEVLDMKKICRVCLSTELNMQSIFESQQNPTIAEMLGELTTHQIESFDNLPSLICSKCLDLVLSAYKLKEQFERTNKILICLIGNKQNDRSPNLSCNAKISKLEKDTQTKEHFIISCQYGEKICLTSSTLNILEVENEASENHINSNTDKDQFDQLDESMLCSEESLSEKEMLECCNNDNGHHFTDDDEVPLSMLIESSNTSQITEDINFEFSEESQNSTEIDYNLENKLQTLKRMRQSYQQQNYNKIKEIIKCNKSEPTDHRESKQLTKRKSDIKPKRRDKLFNCSKCDKKYISEESLQRHLEDHDKKRFVCRQCCEEFSTKDELINHAKVEEHDKPLLCPECGLRCKNSNILTVHIRRHTGEKPFKCKFCNKGFPRLGDMKIHERYHTGEKTHFCDICGKGFFRKYNLRIHLRVHTGEKPYKCTHCPQAFAQSNDLKAHTRRHTGERFRCEVCNAAFLQGYKMRQHKLQEHGIHEIPPTQRLQKFTSLAE